MRGAIIILSLLLSASTFIPSLPPIRVPPTPLFVVGQDEIGSQVDPTALWDVDAHGPLGSLADDFFMDTFRRSLAASNLKLSSEYPPGYGMVGG